MGNDIEMSELLSSALDYIVSNNPAVKVGFILKISKLTQNYTRIINLKVNEDINRLAPNIESSMNCRIWLKYSEEG